MAYDSFFFLFSSFFHTFYLSPFTSKLSFQTFLVVTFYKFLHHFILGSEVNRRFWVAKREGIFRNFAHTHDKKIYKIFVNAIFDTHLSAFITLNSLPSVTT